MAAPRIRDLVLLTVVPLAIFALLAEIGLRLYLSRNTFYDVEMSRYSRLLKVDAEDPRIGHLHRPGGRARLMDVDVRINSDGFRDDEYPLEKGPRWRIVFLGDSLTFGWGVAKQATFEHLLERDLDARRPTEIINFGTGNYNSVQEVRLFLAKGLRYDPDQVVLFYFINDAEPVPQRSSLPWLGDLRIATFYWSRVKALLARFDESAGFHGYYSALYREDAPGWRRSRDALAELAGACRERGIALQVVLLPELHQLADYPFAAEHARVAGFLRERGVPVLDLAPSFASEAGDELSLWVARDDAHPNARAHALIARYSAEFIAAARRAASDPGTT